jgi:hypothetical protein
MTGVKLKEYRAGVSRISDLSTAMMEKRRQRVGVMFRQSNERLVVYVPVD